MWSATAGGLWRPARTVGVSQAAGAALCLLVLLSADDKLVTFAQTQTTTQPTTVSWEVEALNSVFEQWNIKANTQQWNTTGDPCSGIAKDDLPTIDDTNYNPFIKCDCSYDNGTTCHITALKVFALDVVGVLPDQLWNLNYLTNLNLRKNYLSGSISSSISNLTKMQYLTFGTNALSGEVPKELGNLTELLSLAFGTNNFSGSLPPELGQLSSLQQLYIDSCGVTGDIPSTFANLQKLQTVWASDNELTGNIPDFIGNWTQLKDLRLQGNSFTGEIPSSFSNLTNLETLKISDLSNGSSSLRFIEKMKSLGTLILRNNNISGPIPSNIWNFPILQFLDLSFNNLLGSIPRSLFNLNSLNYLFLGNNSLNGSLPTQIGSTLLYIDLSYNELSGSFPSWVKKDRPQLNLVANNFTITSSNISLLSSHVDCLQRNFPCNRGTPIYSSFAVKCGGHQIKALDGTIYEGDNTTLGPATYFITDAENWAVSNVGAFISSSNSTYIGISPSQFLGTVDSELFQTTRFSPGSLRYYGLGLVNGNYTVLLQFAELSILNGQTWKSLGRRVFDIYIQGNLVWKNFDIRKAAGGHSFQAIQQTFTAEVTEGYLEIHFFWAGKGTCCVPAQSTFGPSISAIKVTPNFTHPKNRTLLIVAIIVAVGICISILVALRFFLGKWKSRLNEDEGLEGLDTKVNTFSYSELRSATGDFNSGNKLGEGGFGPVYKGTLADGRIIAVKQLSVASHQGKDQFVAEIAAISAVQHRNLVKLFGCCIEGAKRLLVYEYLENRSLDQALFGNNKLQLDWAQRFDICMGVAKGLAYLHHQLRQRIVHRDVKASNILLDSDLKPKISDFGLAKLYDDKVTHISTSVAGTIGYLAPEYALRGHLTEKVDVFGFGVVALEIVSGRSNYDTSLERDKVYLLEWAWQLHENDQVLDLVDDKLSECDVNEVKRVIEIALLCTQASPTQRPSMSRVLAMLSGDVKVGTPSSKPGYLTDLKLHDESSFLSGTRSSTLTTSYSSKSEGNVMMDSQASPLYDVKIMQIADIGQDNGEGICDGNGEDVTHTRCATVYV